MADYAGKESKAHHVEEADVRTGLGIQDMIAQQKEQDAAAIQDKYHVPIKEIMHAHLDQDQAVVRRIMRRVDLRLMPILSLLYMWAFIDRANLGNANIAGLEDDLNTDIGQRYSILTFIFFVGYCIVDIPAAFLVRRVGPALWLGCVGTAWGVVTIGQGFCQSWISLAVCRALLGLLEGGLVPAATFLLSTWYTRYEIQMRFAGFYVIGNASSGLSGLLAYGIEKLNGTDGLGGWRWIFIVEGIVSTCVGIAAFLIIVDFPEKASTRNSIGLPAFLSPEDSAIVLARIEHDRGDALEDKLSWKVALRHMRDWKLWEFASYLTLNNTGVYAFSYFLPTILEAGFGYSVARAQVLTFPPYACAAVWIILSAWTGDHFKIRGPILIFNASMYITGISLVGFATNLHTRYAGVFLGAMGITANIPTQWAYFHNNMAGQSKKALTIGIMIMGGALGGIIAGNVFQSKDSPAYIPGLAVCISFQALNIVLVAKNFLIFYIQNQRADRGEIIIEGQPGFRHTY